MKKTDDYKGNQKSKIKGYRKEKVLPKFLNLTFGYQNLCANPLYSLPVGGIILAAKRWLQFQMMPFKLARHGLSPYKSYLLQTCRKQADAVVKT